MTAASRQGRQSDEILVDLKFSTDRTFRHFTNFTEGQCYNTDTNAFQSVFSGKVYCKAYMFWRLEARKIWMPCFLSIPTIKYYHSYLMINTD